MNKYAIINSFLEVLRQLVRKINDEVNLLAIVFVLICALVEIMNKQVSKWFARAFVLFYLIAAKYSLAKKSMKIEAQLKEHASNPTFQWRIYYPNAFHNAKSKFSGIDLYFEGAYSSGKRKGNLGINFFFGFFDTFERSGTRDSENIECL